MLSKKQYRFLRYLYKNGSSDRQNVLNYLGINLEKFSETIRSTELEEYYCNPADDAWVLTPLGEAMTEDYSKKSKYSLITLFIASIGALTGIWSLVWQIVS